MKKRNINITIIIILLLFIIDRFVWMPERVKGKTWMLESGRNLGDPMAYKWDFMLNGSEIVFNDNKRKEDYPSVYRNRQSKFYLLGCYFGNFYILDKIRREVIIYSEK
ncbi:hypothetical protein [Flavobacterium lindanitolerans]|uniref:hypothetical protein n=1 Tax=Flavobacterium lindanitolerans TaxID=428988 RepID=UPI0028073884|nr:hypothetical protein [Flavobacterium lindanitolerans]MDQ7960823.1 hypothetical protein [Flavobacterium lindanitolerans]